jgi:hypothetical protein
MRRWGVSSWAPMLATLITILLTQNSQSPSCHTSGGAVACGYHCRAELGEVRCAQTPEGICQRLEGQLVCWDPPEEVRLHDSSHTPRCKAKRGEIACGYSCATSETKLACAQTPWGVCTTRYDEVVCWDPPPAIIHHFTDELKGASCISTETAYACGWNCKQVRSEAQCAQSPRGTCSSQDGRLYCFEPPVPPVSHAPPATRLP